VRAVKEFFDLLQSATITLPVIEVAFLMIALSFCLVFGHTRFGLIAAYVIVYRWGWQFLTGSGEDFILWYFILGSLVGVLTIIGLMAPPHE
jgi:hypothetical protein